MTILTVVTDPLLERKSEDVPKILESFTRGQLENFAFSAGIVKDSAEFFEWLEEFTNNSLYVVMISNDNQIGGFITAKNSREAAMDESIEKEPLIITGFYSHPRDTDREHGMMEVLVECAVVTGHKQLRIPNTSELMREFTDRILSHESFKDIEVINHEDEPEYDCFDLKEFKTYQQLQQMGVAV